MTLTDRTLPQVGSRAGASSAQGVAAQAVPTAEQLTATRGAPELLWRGTQTDRHGYHHRNTCQRVRTAWPPENRLVLPSIFDRASDTTPLRSRVGNAHDVDLLFATPVGVFSAVDSCIQRYGR
jgi:hypothetical protein